MITFTSSFIALKNAAEGITWYHLVELIVNPSTTAFLTTFVETVTWNGQTYRPVGMDISADQSGAEGELPSIYIDVSNRDSQAFRFVRDNDVTLNKVTIRQVNATLTDSGSDKRLIMAVLGCSFSKDAGRFNLGFAFNFDAEGPKRTWNRRDFPSIPFSFANYAII